jgi:hypothetical protein
MILATPANEINLGHSESASYIRHIAIKGMPTNRCGLQHQ